MKITDALRYLLTPHEPDAGWYTCPPEYMTREKAAAEDLEPNALEAVKNETGIFWLNFHDMICPAIAIYLRASGLASIRRDFVTMNENFDQLLERCRLLEIANGNLFHTAIVQSGEAVRQRQRADELEKVLDCALLAPQSPPQSVRTK